jgi:ribonuclease HI
VTNTFVYTDGACRRSGDGGWAFVAVCNGNEVHHESGKDSGTTNNRMELYAILSALVWVSKNRIANVIIVTDSKYCITVLTRAKDQNRSPYPLPKNHDLIKIARTLTAGVKFEWVKGHAGNVWNEQADKRASAARDDNGGLLTLRRAPGRPARIIRPAPRPTRSSTA